MNFNAHTNSYVNVKLDFGIAYQHYFIIITFKIYDSVNVESPKTNFLFFGCSFKNWNLSFQPIWENYGLLISQTWPHLCVSQIEGHFHFRTCFLFLFDTFFISLLLITMYSLPFTLDTFRNKVHNNKNNCSSIFCLIISLLLKLDFWIVHKFFKLILNCLLNFF